MAELQVSSLVDLDRLGRVQGRFAEATDLAIIAVNSRGTPVTEACRFTQFCQRMRADTVRRQLCYGCDAHGGLQAAIKKRPHIYQCHAGLVDFSIPITVGDAYIGAVLCGQVRIERRTGVLDHVMGPDDSWQQDPELRELHDANRSTSLRHVEAAAETLWDVLKDFDDTPRGRVVPLNVDRSSRSQLASPSANGRPAGQPAVAEPVREWHEWSAPPAARPLHPVADIDPTAPFWVECDGENLVAAFDHLNEVMDEIWVGPLAERGSALERLEDGIVEVGRSLCPDQVPRLHHRVLQQRARRGVKANRHDVQAAGETLLLIIFDGLKRLRPKRPRTFQDLLNEVERRGARPYSLTEAAAFLSVSPGHLSKKFKTQTGSSFVAYVMGRRLRRARLMLAHTDVPVIKVANELGFRQANYFARVFRAETGLSPTDYRRQASGVLWNCHAPVSS
jgi:ligand-binding sensor protein/AraC-like DNA-binding protein